MGFLDDLLERRALAALRTIPYEAPRPVGAIALNATDTRYLSGAYGAGLPLTNVQFVSLEITNRNGTAVLEVRPNGGQPYTVPAAASRTITPTVPMDYYEIKATVAAVVAGEVEVIEKGVIRGPPQ